MPDNEIIYKGENGCVTLSTKSYEGTDGVLLKIENPESPVNTVSFAALNEISKALDIIESDKKFKFVILYGSESKIHAGADISMFAGGLNKDENPPDYDEIRRYLNLGTNLDFRVKKLSKFLKTVSILTGERFGGSVEWPLMAEYCVVSPEAGIQFSEVNIGIIPGWDGILNVCLKSGFENALFMGTTGTRISAEQMVASGIGSYISEPEKMMDRALSLAVEKSHSVQKSKKLIFTSEKELFKTLSERMNIHRYEKFIEELKPEQTGMDPKEFSKNIDRKLNEIGRPIAPLAVEAVFGLVSKYGNRINDDDLDTIKEMGEEEAQRCLDLMKTNDRVKGINSILKARENPFNKIPLYKRN